MWGRAWSLADIFLLNSNVWELFMPKEPKKLPPISIFSLSKYYYFRNKFFHIGPDHLQLTLLNWDNESVLALNKKLKFPIHFQKCTYYLCTYVIHNIPSDSGYHSSLDKWAGISKLFVLFFTLFLYAYAGNIFKKKIA